jgi:hypothetical protein
MNLYARDKDYMYQWAQRKTSREMRFDMILFLPLLGGHGKGEILSSSLSISLSLVEGDKLTSRF